MIARPVALHSRMMEQGVFVAVIAASLVVACEGSTTSLGGPKGELSSASSVADGGSDDGATLPSSSSTTSGGLDPVCHGYTWAPESTGLDCDYRLPSGPPPNDDPRLDPATWNPNRVHIEVWGPNMPEVWGYFRRSAASCEDEDGWYYAPPENGELPASFRLCPKSCASAATQSAYLRLTAMTYCE